MSLRAKDMLSSIGDDEVGDNSSKTINVQENVKVNGTGNSSGDITGNGNPTDKVNGTMAAPNGHDDGPPSNVNESEVRVV